MPILVFTHLICPIELLELRTVERIRELLMVWWCFMLNTRGMPSKNQEAGGKFEDVSWIVQK
jgi:hypothetical protein